METAEFEKLLASKERKFRITAHAMLRIRQRKVNHTAIEEEIRVRKPVVVVEEPCDEAGERKFGAYYRQSGPYYHAYIVALNNGITVWRENKDRQKRIIK